jgi:hypothetical protein
VPGLIPLPKATLLQIKPGDAERPGDGDICAATLLGDLRAGTRIHKKLSALANFFETTSFTSD